MFSKFIEENATCFRHDDLSVITIPVGAKKLVLKCMFGNLGPQVNVSPVLLNLAVNRNTRRESSPSPEMGAEQKHEQKGSSNHARVTVDMLQVVNTSQRNVSQELVQKSLKNSGEREALSSLSGFF